MTAGGEVIVVFGLFTVGAVAAYAVGYAVAGRREARTTADLSGPYPNGSTPYWTGPESRALRARRFACASVNHYPRRYDGSWCFGFGYVCKRCYMYADPVPQRQREAMVDEINKLPADQQQQAMARLSGGGPR